MHLTIGFIFIEISMYSTKEMKKITAKRYRKLPEVQQKLLDEREKRQRNANKMLAGIFNKVLMF